MIESIAKAVIGIIDSLIGVFQLGQRAEKHSAKSGHVGESRLDHEARTGGQTSIRTWYILSFILLLLLGGTGSILWRLFASH